MSEKAKGDGTGCVGCLTVIVFNCTVGGLCFHYCLQQLLAKNIPWYADAFCGLFAGEVAVPLALVLWVLACFGVNVR